MVVSVVQWQEQKAEFEVFPKYKEMYLKAFEKMLDARNGRGLTNNANWETANDVFEWWLH